MSASVETGSPGRRSSVASTAFCFAAVIESNAPSARTSSGPSSPKVSDLVVRHRSYYWDSGLQRVGWSPEGDHPSMSLLVP
jgi:hypothetical protein